MGVLFFLTTTAFRRRGESGGCGSLGFFLFLLALGLVLYFVLRGRKDRPEQLGASKRAMGSGSIPDHTFACPYAKCPTCAASGDKMKQQWDGLRKVTWTCGYCGNVAGVQELKDEELPPSARQRLGLDAPPPGMAPGQSGYYPPQGGGGAGDLLTGMMIGTMLGGDHHSRRGDDWGGGGSGGDSSSSGDWGDSGSSDNSNSDSDGDWGDSGGGDSGGDDF